MTKRQRGRLYASQNKPKSPITVTHDSPSFLRVHAVVIISACETSYIRFLWKEAEKSLHTKC
ncbi:hypothetical protein HID58_080799 [Brassica napus]|uniref:Uncharacterized protein n=1 Tax=Brassica napus TaxID=3708 RepID=A0ABQ7Y5X1_BRANA|nr:hypothetical protein HID58_080799 [Brassica napus]